jgi:hypothetical protein|tara:strand:+ start:89 stop:226 length:138 start_codon:yes stop_codon:yes gene_type:complete
MCPWYLKSRSFNIVSAVTTLLGLSEKDRCSKSSEDTEPDGKLEKL